MYTDGSVKPDSSAIGVWIQSAELAVKAKLSHKTSSTVSELTAARAALLYITNGPVRQWVMFLDSQTALKVLVKLLQRRSHLVRELSTLHPLGLRDGQIISLQ